MVAEPEEKMTRKEKAKGFWQSAKKRKKEDEDKEKKQNYEKKRQRQKIDNSQFHEMHMCGFSVKLPLGLQPYPSQKLIMVRILTALSKMQNVIAESPTGSGKTMALLASTCAWLMKYKEELKSSRDFCQVHGLSIINTASEAPVEEDVEMSENSRLEESLMDQNVDPNSYEAELNKDFVPYSPSPSVLKTPGALKTPQSTTRAGKEKEPYVCTCLPRVRIYYGTRTHKQIGQVVKEFKRLPYAGIIKHTILASREQSCINEQARRSRDVTSFCQELLRDEGLGCQFKTNMRSFKLDNPYSMRKHIDINTETVFDIEELVEGLKISRPAVCPYFTSTRVLTGDADLIFTPFTYLVDPIIRDSSDVVLKSSIIILDEAHNIEDTCREGASFSFAEREVADALISLQSKSQLIQDKIATGCDTREKIDQLEEYANNLKIVKEFVCDIWEWFQETAEPCKYIPADTYTKQKNLTKNWSLLLDCLTYRPNNRSLLKKKGTAEHEFFWKAFNAVLAKGEEENKSPIFEFKPSHAAIIMVEKWLYFSDFFTQEMFKNTYRMNICMEKSTQYSNTSFREVKFGNNQGPKNVGYSKAEDIWMDSAVGPWNIKPVLEGFKTTISMWCMSPAITFLDAFAESRSVILASGTLCPIETLKTELGTEFKLEVEGKQVIPSERIFASVVSVGPTGCQLKLTQDMLRNNGRILEDVANVIKDVCNTVPRGVLCFCPSYKMIDDIMKVIKSGIIETAIRRKKVIFEEPRVSASLNEVMGKYDDVLQHPKQYGEEVDGALMMAVFRGKISEGIDFADDKARAVITVGIPYPNFGDPLVTEKRKYNTENSKTMRILDGDSWYSTQAYRALNQALGRCLRHKNDWGALVLIDERLSVQAQSYTGFMRSTPSAKISKWIREQLVVFQDYNNFSQSLERFLRSMEQDNIPTTPIKRQIVTSVE